MQKLVIMLIMVLISIKLYGEGTDNYQGSYPYVPSKYKAEDFYGTWVAVKVKTYFCGVIDVNKYKPFDEVYTELGKTVIISKEEYVENISKYPSSVKENGFKYFAQYYEGFAPSLSSVKANGFKYFTQYYEGHNYENFEDTFDYNTYDFFGVYGFIPGVSEIEEPYSKYGHFGTLYIVNKDKLIYEDYEYRDILYTLVREEEAKRIEKYSIEIPYNYVGTMCNYFVREPEVLTKLRVSTKEKELDEYAKKVEKEGKYRVIRRDIGNSAVEGE